jgi:Peptidase family C25
MKKLLTICLIFISCFSFAQTKGDVTINWLPKTELYFGENKINVPQFEGDSFSYNDAKKTILFTLKIADSNNSNTNISITNVAYETISANQLGDLALENIPNTVSEIVLNQTSRDIVQKFLQLSPIIRDGFGYKRIKSFSYSTNPSTAKTAQTLKTASISNSVLATGDWYRFSIEKSGVYKISKSFLEQIGLNTNNLNPKKIKIYGNGGRMLPLKNNVFYPIDLTENNIEIIGESDGVFNNEDYILFYGEGVDNWSQENKTNINLYDSKSYYYVTAQGEDGKRITTMQQPTGNSTLSLSTFDDYQFHEIDKINIAHLGRQWFGEIFDINSEQEFDFSFPNIDVATPVKIAATFASFSSAETSFKVLANNQNVGQINISRTQGDGIEFVVNTLPNNTKFTGSENVKVKITYNNGGIPNAKGYLDYINLVAKRKLSGYGKQFRFQYDLAGTSSGIVNYDISNATGISQVWDITDIYNASKIINLNQSAFSFKANLGEVRKYIAIDEADYFTPTFEAKSKIANQNLKGTIFKNTQGQFQDIDYVIITPESLRSQAEKLANFHRSYSNLNTKVITLESIYPEFSSGKQDVAAIRNCIKYIYDNASVPEKRIKYLNLFGDGSFDYKNRITNNSNVVPTYEALESATHGQASFASDDFFGLMDSNEGDMNIGTNLVGGIDIAVGRMLVNDAKQADEMVNKVIEYHDIKSFGSWRSNIVMIADDGDSAISRDFTLQTNQNNLADAIGTQKPFLNINKILLDSYTQETSSGGQRYPKAKTDLFNAFEKGALTFNYLGHGGEDGLTAERLWDKSDGQNLKNQYKYPLFITITCEFSRFDNPSRPTAGEFTYWNPKGGAIALVSTIRAISKDAAESFNDKFAKELFSFGSNQYKTIADALRTAKNNNPTNISSKVIFYFGDPALMLAIPKPKIRLTKVNDISTSQPIEDLKSLAKMKLSGEIVDENNNILSNYNGELATTIFDKNISRITLNNDGKSPPIPFITLGETIFRGNSSIKNGLFEFSFVVPRDIKIPVGNGKVSFYARKNEVLENQIGFDTTIKVGGINENAVADNISPKVKLYMNDESFISGGTTNASPFLLAQLEDENGINTASGIGHDIVAVLDGDVNNPFILNDYYQTKLDDYTHGTLRFPLRNLAVGLHTISFKAWDVYNNPVIREIQFVVVGNEELALTHVLNYPNPFVNYTEFWFSHNRPFEPLEVQVQVMTITGKVVWSKNQIITTEGFLSKEITWDGKDDFGDRLGKGVYVYKLTVKSTITNTKTEKFEKLVIL